MALLNRKQRTVGDLVGDNSDEPRISVTDLHILGVSDPNTAESLAPLVRRPRRWGWVR